MPVDEAPPRSQAGRGRGRRPRPAGAQCGADLGQHAHRARYPQLGRPHPPGAARPRRPTLAVVTDAETGQRGFVITGDPSYLEPYIAARQGLNAELDDLERLTADHPAQNARVREIRQLAWTRDDPARQRHPRAPGAGLRRRARDDRRRPRQSRRCRRFAHRGRCARRSRKRRCSPSASGRGRPRLRDRRRHRAAVGAGGAGRRRGAARSSCAASCASGEAATVELADRAELLRITLASIGDAVITTDTEGRVTTLNPVAEALTGWPLAEAEGQPLAVGVPDRRRGDRAPVANPAERALAEGVIVGLANHTLLIDRQGGRASDRRQRRADPPQRRRRRRLRPGVSRHQPTAGGPSRRCAAPRPGCATR